MSFGRNHALSYPQLGEKDEAYLMHLKKDLEPRCWFLGRGSRLQGVALCPLLRWCVEERGTTLHTSGLCCAFLTYGSATQCQASQGVYVGDRDILLPQKGDGNSPQFGQHLQTSETAPVVEAGGGQRKGAGGRFSG